MVARTVTNGVARRARLATALAGLATLSLLAAGCASSSGADSSAEPSAEASGLYNEELHALLPESIQDSGVLTFGALWETPPVISVDAADPTKPVGISPSLAAAMGEILGVDVEWENLAWPAQLPALQAGSVDVLFGQVSVSAEREQSVVDLIPFQRRGQGILVPDGNPESLESIADMCGLTLGVPIGSNQSAKVTAISEESCVGEGKDPIVLAEYQGAAAAVQALRAGTIDGWFDVMPSLAGVVKAAPGVFEAIEIPEDEVPTEFSGIAISKDNPGLSEAIAAALQTLIENGTYGEIYGELGLEAAELTADEIVINPITGTPAGEMAAS